MEKRKCWDKGSTVSGKKQYQWETLLWGLPKPQKELGKKRKKKNDASWYLRPF